jgi:hypothetical protein
LISLMTVASTVLPGHTQHLTGGLVKFFVYGVGS